MRQILALLIAAVTNSAFAVANANSLSLDFEGISGGQSVGSFYNGGAGTNYGIDFVGSSYVLIEGAGLLANVPSGAGAFTYLTGFNAFVNIDGGFTDALSVNYSSSISNGYIDIYSGLNGTGDLLGTISLNAQFRENCSPELSAPFCNWSVSAITFSGVGKSVSFGRAGPISAYFDDLTFGSVTPGQQLISVPEPASIALFATSLFGMFTFRIRRHCRCLSR